MNSSPNTVGALAISPDGNTVGFFSTLSDVAINPTLTLAVFDPTGHLLHSTRVTLAGGSTTNGSLAIQKNGKILLALYDTRTTNHFQTLVERFNSNLTVDKTFGQNGIATLQGLDRADSLRPALAVQSDGKILVGGSDQHGFALARLTSAGVLDTSFATNGFAATPFSDQASIDHLLIQPDGAILAAGNVASVTNDIPANNKFAIVRYTPQGLCDTSFASNGILLQNLGLGTTLVNVALSPDKTKLFAFSNVIDSDTHISEFEITKYSL